MAIEAGVAKSGVNRYWLRGWITVALLVAAIVIDGSGSMAEIGPSLVPQAGVVGSPFVASGSAGDDESGVTVYLRWDDAECAGEGLALARGSADESGAYSIPAVVPSTDPAGVGYPPAEYAVAACVLDVDVGFVPVGSSLFTVLGPPLAAEANGPYDVDIGDAVSFSSEGSSGAVYRWTFGDGTGSEEPNPSHIYGPAGSYNVVLEVFDAAGLSLVDVTTATVHAPPVAADVNASVAAGGSVPIDLTSAISDVNGDADLTTLEIDSAVLLGVAAMAETGVVVYTAPSTADDFADSFLYSVADRRGRRSDFGVVTISVEGVAPSATVAETTPTPSSSTAGPEPNVANTPTTVAPTVQAQDDRAATDGEPVTIHVLSNDTVPPGESDVRIVAGPAHGSAAVSTAGAIVYTPEAPFEGLDELSYEVCVDGVCSTAQVFIRVRLLCDVASARARRFTIEPTPVPAGEQVSLTAELEVERLDSRCGDFPSAVTLDDRPWSELILRIRSESEGLIGVPGVIAAGALQESSNIGTATLDGFALLIVPPATPAGTYTVRLLGGSPLRILAERAIEVVAPPVVTTTVVTPTTVSPEDDGGISGALVVGGATLLAALAGGAGTIAVARRRRYEDPCPGPRRALVEAQQTSTDALHAAETAEQRAHDLEAAVAEAEAALSECLSRHTALPVIGVRRAGRSQLASPEKGYYLEQHANPYAPGREELQGWFGLHRGRPIQGIVIHSGGVLPPTVLRAVDAAQDLATVRQPLSFHAVVDDAGVIPLLSDERRARHLADADDTGLGVLWMAGTDPDRALENLARWCAAKSDEHGFPIARVDLAAWTQGDQGLIAAVEFPERAGVIGQPLDWDRLLTLAKPDSELLVGTPIGSGGTCEAEERRRDEARSAATEAQAEATRLRGEADAAVNRAATAQRELDDCECRHPAIATPVNPATQEHPDESDVSRWFLLAHQNRHGGLRSNGRHGWYYPGRRQAISGIVVHTAESHVAAGVARYLSNVRRAASAHVAVDALGPIDLLPDGTTAFHAKDGNSRGLGLEICYKAANWGTDPEYEDALYRNAAAWCALKVMQYGIPVQRVSAAQWHDGVPGFVSHAELDPARRNDPGQTFDWAYFFELIREYMGGSLLDDGESPVRSDE